jgi:hypothetical protein
MGDSISPCVQGASREACAGHDRSAITQIANADRSPGRLNHHQKQNVQVRGDMESTI